MTEEDKKELRKLFYSNEFGHVDGHEWMMGEDSFELLWGWIVSRVELRVMPESNGQIKYAIKHKDKFMLMQVSNSEKQLDEKIETAYWLAQGIQPKGSNYTKEKFMEGMERVKVTFEKIG